MLGQIELFGFNFARLNFAPCQGQLLPIASNQQLFSLLGTAYGRNGVTNFALPNLRPVTPQGPILLYLYRRRFSAAGVELAASTASEGQAA